MRAFLDTSALIALSGLGGASVAEAFVKTCKERGITLCVNHIQVDEKVHREIPNYEERMNRAVKALKDLELEVS
jgi:hypothetical protein